MPVNIQDFPANSFSSRRIILLGQTGVGKSAAGNTILGQKEFIYSSGAHPETRECSVKHATISGRSVSVVDTPGFIDTQMRPGELMTEIARSVYLSSPGPHAFLIVFPVNMWFTEQDQQIPQMIEMMFGEEVLKYSIILFTHGDLLKKSVEELIEENEALRCLADQCGGRFHVFSDENQKSREQVNDLLQKTDTMIEQNRGGHYSNQMFEDAQRFRQEEEERRQREEEERRQREEEAQQRSELEMSKGKNQSETKTSSVQSYFSKYWHYIDLGAAVGAAVGAVGAAAVAAGVQRKKEEEEQKQQEEN